MNWWSRLRCILRPLHSCVQGATATAYIIVLGCVSLVGSIAFSQLRKEVETAAKAEAMLVAQAKGDANEGPVGSVYAEAAAAGAEELVVAVPFAFGAKAGKHAVAGFRKKRGRSADSFDSRRPSNDDTQRSSDPSTPNARDPSRDGDPPRSGDRDAPTCTGPSCGKKGSCFVAGTLVQTPSGPRPIESIAKGDTVLSADEVTLEVTQSLVAEVVMRNTSSLIALTLGSAGAQDTYWVTPEHPFYAPKRGWVPASDKGPIEIASCKYDKRGDSLEVHELRNNKSSEFRGMGTLLMQQVGKDAQSEGAAKVKTTSTAQEAMAFYESLGLGPDRTEYTNARNALADGESPRPIDMLLAQLPGDAMDALTAEVERARETNPRLSLNEYFLDREAKKMSSTWEVDTNELLRKTDDKIKAVSEKSRWKRGERSTSCR